MIDEDEAISFSESAPQSRSASSTEVVERGHLGDSGILNVRSKCRSVGTNAPANMGRHRFAGE